MQQQDQSAEIEVEEKVDAEMEQKPDDSIIKNNDEISPDRVIQEEQEEQGKTGSKRFDWLAVGILLFIAAFFAVTARFNNQPAPSFVPAAALSATGCGLLVTALRKLRPLKGPGVFEALLGGFLVAFFQFAIALTYPNVFATLTSDSTSGRAFLLTWGLIGLFTMLLSLAGAALGYLAFAPLRPLPERAARKRIEESEEEEDESLNESIEVESEGIASSSANQFEQEDEEDEEVDVEGVESDEETGEKIAEKEEKEQEEETTAEEEEKERDRQNTRSLPSYAITVLLIGLLPMIVGYVFAAAYDFLMNVIAANSIAPGLYPTLSLLSGLLPWRLAAPITLTGNNGSFIIFTLLWRIPDSFLGNPNMFDVQTLEPLFLNAAALALLLITTYGREHGDSQVQRVPTRVLIFLEALLGLALVLPASLWILRGLEGVFQSGNLVLPLPTVQLLDSPMFILNLVTGPLFCFLVGLIVLRQYQLWRIPGRKQTETAKM